MDLEDIEKGMMSELGQINELAETKNIFPNLEVCPYSLGYIAYQYYLGFNEITVYLNNEPDIPNKLVMS